MYIKIFIQIISWDRRRSYLVNFTDSLIDFEELSVQNAVKHVYGVYERPPNSDDYDNNLRDSIETVETAFDRYGLLRRLCYSARSSSSIYRDPLSPTGPPTHFDGTRVRSFILYISYTNICIFRI